MIESSVTRIFNSTTFTVADNLPPTVVIEAVIAWLNIWCVVSLPSIHEDIVVVKMLDRMPLIHLQSSAGF